MLEGLLTIGVLVVVSVLLTFVINWALDWFDV